MIWVAVLGGESNDVEDHALDEFIEALAEKIESGQITDEREFQIAQRLLNSAREIAQRGKLIGGALNGSH